MTKISKSLSPSFSLERTTSLDVNKKTPPVNIDSISFSTEVEASSSRFMPNYGNTSEQIGVNLEASTPVVGMSNRMGDGYGERYPDEQIGQEQPGESNEAKGPGDASPSKGKGKVDPVDKKAEKKRISAKAKVDLKAGRIPAFLIGGTCEFLLSQAPVTQSLGVTPPASLPVNSDSLAIPPCSAVQTAVDVSQPPLPRAPTLTPLARSTLELSSESFLLIRKRTDEARNRTINSGSRIISAYEAVIAKREEQIKSLLARTDVVAARKELDREMTQADTWEISAAANRQSADDYAAQVETLKEEKQKLEEDMKKRDAHLEAASARWLNFEPLWRSSALRRIVSGRSVRKHAAKLMRLLVAVLPKGRDIRLI
ncbi:hypothetical protein AALP_AA1G339300 [Arabis alpina]|uniref:Uncharacterized protein n=1 Tax=Arabis alpina TaxID=50452 RepID=A0A087HSG7_ARAAL|nr:hypothetical protein AALP_AA1G339300 [Arabis alpina]